MGMYMGRSIGRSWRCDCARSRSMIRVRFALCLRGGGLRSGSGSGGLPGSMIMIVVQFSDHLVQAQFSDHLVQALSWDSKDPLQ